MTHAPRREKPRRRSSLRVTEGFRAFVLEQLRDAGEITPRAMFGGVGLYCDGIFFGIIAGDVLYLKVDDSTRAEYEAQGMSAFRPYAGRPGTMQYYEVPLTILESPVDLAAWARTAVKVAARAHSATRCRSRKGSF
jgi:DNA transformation protein and related proteins